MEKVFPINVMVGDRTYRVKVSSEDEQTVRQAVKDINDKISAFKTQYGGKDMQDYIAMVTLWLATSTPANNSTQNIENQENVALNKIDALLDQVLEGGR